MKVIDFIKTHENWRELLAAAPYFLTIKEKGNLVLFKYSQLNSDFYNPIVCECRGLILEKGTWKIVRHAFDKFFNYGEAYAADLDWNSNYLNVTEKMDGSLISLYWYNNKWNIATNGNISAADAPLEAVTNQYKTFEDLALAAFEKAGLVWERLNKDYTWTFELCSPLNQAVCKFAEIELYLTGIRVNKTGKELPTYLYDIGVPAAKSWTINSLEDAEKLVESMGDNQEGIVVWDMATGDRLKLKTQRYFELHYLINKQRLGKVGCYEIIMKNEDSELLAYFPCYADLFADRRAALNLAIRHCHVVQQLVDDWQEKHPTYTRADFVAWAKAMAQKNDFRYYILAFEDRLETEMENITDVHKLIRFYNL